MKFVEPNQEDASFINDNFTSDIMKGWRGVAFEQVCWQHIVQIRRALEIGGVKASISAWKVQGTESKAGAQIDLLIVRNDNIVNPTFGLVYGKHSGKVQKVISCDDLYS